MTHLKLPEAPLPAGLRQRTLDAYDLRRPRRTRFFSWKAFSWKWALAAAALIAASAAAFQFPLAPNPDTAVTLADGNRLVIRSVIDAMSFSQWMTLLAFRSDTSLRNGKYQQILQLRTWGPQGPHTHFGFRMQAQPAGGGTYDLAFTKPVDPPATIALIPAHVTLRAGQTWSVRLVRTAWYACFAVVSSGAPVPPCERPPNFAPPGPAGYAR